MNYIRKDDKKFIRIHEQLTPVNERFRVIILVDKKLVNNYDLVFLNRFEKMILSFGKLLDDDLTRISQNLIDEIKLKSTINKYKNINYSLRDLLINCKNEDIQAMIYYLSNKLKNEDNEDNEDQEENKTNVEKIKEIVIKKIY
jgi:hypothetical protein